MSKRYKEITKRDFDDFMLQYNAKIIYPDRTIELVYRIPLKNSLSIWVYSTIEQETGKSRSSGSDAIRTIMMTKDTYNKI